MIINLSNKNITKLDLSNQNLKVFPKEIFELKNLRKLNLSNNQIKEIPKEIENLKLLNTLDLSNNKISGLYSNFFNLKFLKILNFNNNKIKILPRQISNLKLLTNLYLSNNLIKELPSEFYELKKLKELDISRNEIKSISEKIGNLTELKKLWLNNLDIVNFPADKIKSLPNLASLYCFSSQNINIQNKTYFDLTKIKGNSLGKLKLNETHKEILKEVNDNIHELNINLEPKIFISYSHQDNHWLNRIQTHLRVLKNHLNLDFDLWDDERLTTGDDWEKEIKEAINESDIAILIISTDFLASDFITKKEIPPILENAEKKGVKIMPIVVEHCYFEISEISKFQSVNPPNKPLSSLSKSDSELYLIKFVKDIGNILLKNSSK